MAKRVNIGRFNERITLQAITTTDETIVDLNTIWARVEPLRGNRQLEYEQLHVGQWYQIEFQYLQRVSYAAGDPIKYDNLQLTVHSLTELEERVYRVMAYATDVPAAANSFYGTKSSAVDAGTATQVAYDDDYFYICTTSGTAGNAVWKKYTLSVAP